MAKVLLVEDEQEIGESQKRLLEAARFTVELVGDARAALEMLRRSGPEGYDVVVSDIKLPEMDGLTFLEQVRTFNTEVPFLFTTGYPCWQSAAEAIELGIFAYMVKPVDNALFTSKVRRASQLYALARLQRQASLALADQDVQVGSLREDFQQALGSLWMAYQPIVSISRRQAYAYEALVRNDSPALRAPPDLLQAAARLNESSALSRQIRAAIAHDIRPLASGSEDEGPLFFVNINPADLKDPTLIQLGASPLAELAERVVLEITERDSLQDIPNLSDILQDLRALGYRIALDDLGQGYAGLNTLLLLDPDYVKLDMSLIRNIDRDQARRQVVSSILALCRDMNIQAITEGIETREEHDTLVSLGAELMQGYLYARPQQGFPSPEFPDP